jgi:hypothetical protein
MVGVIRYEQIKGDKKRLLALTGLTQGEFEELLTAFSQARQTRIERRWRQTGKKRQRQAGGGRTAILDNDEQKLLFALMYQKSYPVQELLAATFEMSQSRCNYWIHELLPTLKDALDILGVLPERDPEQFAKHEASHKEPPELIIDGTERRRQRPKNKEKQALHYSGKKKTHTDKNVVISNAKTKRVSFLSQTYPGTAHDKKIADHQAIRYPPTTTLYKDTGFQGYEPTVKHTRQPKKAKERRTDNP